MSPVSRCRRDGTSLHRFASMLVRVRKLRDEALREVLAKLQGSRNAGHEGDMSVRAGTVGHGNPVPPRLPDPRPVERRKDFRGDRSLLLRSRRHAGRACQRDPGREPDPSTRTARPDWSGDAGTRRQRTVSALALVSAMIPFAAIAAPDASEQGRARDAYAAAIASAWGLSPHALSVQPQHPGVPDDPHAALATPPFFAFRADWSGMDPGPRGFASADGRVASARTPGALRDVLEAAGLDRSPPPLDAIVKRLMWVYQPASAYRAIDGHPRIAEAVPPELHRSEEGAVRVVWYVVYAGATGSSSVLRSRFTLPAEGAPTFRVSAPIRESP